MINYLKSECYRVIHGKAIYVFTIVLTVLGIAYNVILFGFNRMAGGFPYGTVHFSLTTAISNMKLLFYAAFLVVAFLCTDEYKNGAIKNTIAGGIGRSQIFLGKCIVCGVMASISAAVILTGYVASAYVLLEQESSSALEVLLKGVAANLPGAFAALILAVALYCIVKKEIQIVLWWFVVMCGIPLVSFFLGLKIEGIRRIAEWMPFNYLSYEVSFVFAESRIQALWMEPQGLAKCLIAGMAGIVVFTVFGIVGFRKKDIQ